MCIATALVLLRTPRLAEALLLPSVCLAAIVFVLAFTVQTSPCASRSLLILGAAATGLVLRSTAINPSNSMWIGACALASLAMVSISAFVMVIARAAPSRSYARESRAAARLLVPGWAVTAIYALAWAALAVFESPLALQALTAALGLTLFPGLGALLIMELSGPRPIDGLRAELGLYFCWLNLALLGVWIGGQRAMLLAAG
jgi:hypothetical protein